MLPADIATVSTFMNLVLAIDFKERDVVLRQVQLAKITVEKFYSYFYIIFDVDECAPSLTQNSGAPVMMTAMQPNNAPVDFILHVKNNVISELEIYTADFSLLDIQCVSLLKLEYHV